MMFTTFFNRPKKNARAGHLGHDRVTGLLRGIVRVWEHPHLPHGFFWVRAACCWSRAVWSTAAASSSQSRGGILYSCSWVCLPLRPAVVPRCAASGWWVPSKASQRWPLRHMVSEGSQGRERLPHHLRQGLGDQGGEPPGDPGLLRVEGPHVLRELQRAAPGRLPADGERGAGRGLHGVGGPRLLLQERPQRLPVR